MLWNGCGWHGVDGSSFCYSRMGWHITDNRKRQEFFPEASDFNEMSWKMANIYLGVTTHSLYSIADLNWRLLS